MALALTATTLSCGEDPALQRAELKLEPSDFHSTPANASAVEAKWEDAAIRAYVARVTWDAVYRWNSAQAIRMAVAVERARYDRERLRNRRSSVEQGTSPLPGAGGSSIWDRLAQCESGGHWDLSTGNGYYGGLQWLPSTWHAYGGTGMPHHASREQQIAVAERVLAAAGGRFTDWPGCRAKLGLP